MLGDEFQDICNNRFYNTHVYILVPIPWVFSLSWFYTRFFNHGPKPKMSNENNGMCPKIDHPNLDMSIN